MTTAMRADAAARINPPTTAEELLAWPDDDPGEIVDGVFVPKYPDGVVTGTGFAHGIVTAALTEYLRRHVRTARLGRVVGAETAFRLRRHPDLVRCPDVAFVAVLRLGGGIPRRVFDGPPDLAVEVLSPTDRPGEVSRKVVEYLTHGVPTVWEVDPEARTIIVHRPRTLPRLLHGDSVLDGGEVLPGFQLTVGEVFTDLDPDLTPAPGA